MRGFSNHRRIEILQLLQNHPELSVFEIAEALHVNFKTVSEHTRRLTFVGLVRKRNEGAAVRHAVSPLGTIILKFLRTIE